jgi:hypothetical protein
MNNRFIFIPASALRARESSKNANPSLPLASRNLIERDGSASLDSPISFDVVSTSKNWEAWSLLQVELSIGIPQELAAGGMILPNNGSSAVTSRDILSFASNLQVLQYKPTHLTQCLWER